MLDVIPVTAFEDNYIWLLADRSTGFAACVDPGDAEPVLAALREQNLKLCAILITHHHGDHTGGVKDLLKTFPVPVYGPAREAIADVTHRLKGDDTITLPPLSATFEIIDVSGHTNGHIAYFGHDMLFCGDTLFSAGCGRMFEGTPEALLDSLERLGGLPFDTRVYCGHEYTLSNLQFAKTVEPQNEEIDKYQAWCVAQRACHLPTLPSTIGLERHVNPFLRCGQPRVKESAARHAGRDLPTNVNVFATLRSWKDGFRG